MEVWELSNDTGLNMLMLLTTSHPPPSITPTSHPSAPEWQRISLDSDRGVQEDKLVDANVAYLGWLTDNLASMDPARKEGVVSPTAQGGWSVHTPLHPPPTLQVSLLLRQSCPAPTRDSLSVYVCSNFVLSHFIRVTKDRTLQLKVAAILSWHIHANSALLVEQSPTDVCV